MAKVRFENPERSGFGLPPVCMCCGAEATVFKTKQFSWYPTWVPLLLLIGLLPFIIVALILTKRMRVKAPLCKRHRNHWFARQALILLSFLGLIGLVVSTVVLAPTPMKEETTALLFIGGVVGFLAWLVFAVVLHVGTIRPTEITRYSITLEGVAPEFKEAVQASRRASLPNLDRDVGEHWDPSGRHEDRQGYRDADNSDRPSRSRSDYFPEER
jgi:hypothetical protein